MSTSLQEGDLIRWISEEKLRVLQASAQAGAVQNYLEDIEDLGFSESLASREYQGRYLFELLQNADDAISDQIRQRKETAQPRGRYKVAYYLTGRSLLVANEGCLFNEHDVLNLCRFGKSSKDPRKSIGYKGIGFKSVMEVTHEPEIYSGEYCFGFSQSEARRVVTKIAGIDLPRDMLIPLHRFVFPRSVNDVPDEDRKAFEELGGYSTIVRLPLRVDINKTLADLDRDIRPELLLFLKGVDEIEVYIPGRPKAVFKRFGTAAYGNESEDFVRLTVNDSITGDWLVFRSPEIEIEDRTVISALEDRQWEKVTHVSCAFAFLTPNAESVAVPEMSQLIYAYFPTEVRSGFRFLINADYYLGGSRKSIPANRYNQWLSSRMADYLKNQVIPGLVKHFPREASIVDVLSPSGEPQGQMAQELYDSFVENLKLSSFVPLQRGGHGKPSEVAITPVGADAEKFRVYLPMDRIALNERALAVTEVENKEKIRISKDKAFLTNLGAVMLTVKQALANLKDAPPSVDVSRAREVLDFFADWRNKADELIHFTSSLRDMRCIPTARGWALPSDRTFHPKTREDEADPPSGFPFQVVAFLTYAEPRWTDPVFRLLSELGVSSQTYREVILRGIAPVLREPASYPAILKDSLVELYHYLWAYWQAERTGDPRVRRILEIVPVPAARVLKPDKQWRPANTVYFGTYWTGTEELEHIYGEFDDIFFLGEVDELCIDEETKKQEWYSFFAWLGVAALPRVEKEVYEPQVSPDLPAGYRLLNLTERHPHCRRRYWSKYLRHIDEPLHCDAGHGDSNQYLLQSYALHRFDDLVKEANATKLERLFHLLGSHWDNYSEFKQVNIRCNHGWCSKPNRFAPSYLLYELQESSWIPAIVRGRIAGLLRPREVWHLGSAEPAMVRSLVPSLHREFESERLGAFRNDIGITDPSRATPVEYVELLRRLPEMFVLNPQNTTQPIAEEWRRGVIATFRWVCERLQNALIAGGIESANSISEPEQIQLVAEGNGRLEYRPARETVFSDDSTLYDVWQGKCYFVRIDEDWGRLREFLHIPRLSEIVESRIEPGHVLAEETTQLQHTFVNTVPYFLTIVGKSQPSRLERVAGLLGRLQLSVVSSLDIQQSLKGTHEIISVPTYSYLKTQVTAGVQTGFSIKSGELYITSEAGGNPFVISGHLASYIEIERLGDAFGTLLDMRSEEDKWRFLIPKGVKLDDYERMKELFGLSEESAGESTERSPIGEKLDAEFEKLVKAGLGGEASFEHMPSVQRLPEEAAGKPSAVEEETEVRASEEFVFPDFDLDAIPLEDYEPGSGKAPEPITGRTGGGTRTGSWNPPSESRKKAIGKRGEEIVWEKELQRLYNLGYPDPQQVLKWVSKDNETSNHDFASKDENNQDIWIEVKATEDDSDDFEWPKTEIDLAIAARRRYYIYRVYYATTANPRVKRFQDPIGLWLNGELSLNFSVLRGNLPADINEGGS